MMEDAQNIIKIVDEINEMFFDKIQNLNEIHQISFTTQGYYQIIQFCDHVLWTSEEDPREFFELINDYEDLKTFIIKEFNSFINDLQNLYKITIPANGFEIYDI